MDVPLKGLTHPDLSQLVPCAEDPQAKNKLFLLVKDTFVFASKILFSHRLALPALAEKRLREHIYKTCGRGSNSSYPKDIEMGGAVPAIYSR